MLKKLFLFIAVLILNFTVFSSFSLADDRPTIELGRGFCATTQLDKKSAATVEAFQKAVDSLNPTQKEDGKLYLRSFLLSNQAVPQDQTLAPPLPAWEACACCDSGIWVCCGTPGCDPCP